MGDLFLGLDVGTSSTKALLVDGDGVVRAAATVEYPLESPRPNWSEQSPAHWWDAAIATIQAVFKESGAIGEDVACIGLTGQMHGLVLLDADGTVLRPAILWNDQRTGAQCTSMHERIGRDRLIEITGKPALTGFTAPKILWVREHEPTVFAKARSMLLPKDYIRFRLSGVRAIDVADASGTSLLDVKRRSWSSEVTDALGLDPAMLPPVFESPEVCAQVSDEAARLTGLRKGTPIVAGAGDQAAEAVGTGVVRRGGLSMTMGTSGVVFAATEGVPIDERGAMHTYCHALPDTWHVMGVMLSAAGSLQWFRDALCADLVQRAQRSGERVYDLITQEAAAVEAGSDGLFFLPYLTGERCPHPDPDARGVFLGLTRRHGRAHMARAVLEGVAFGLADLHALAMTMGVPADGVRISGGGAGSALWRQIVADVIGQSVSIPSTTHGAAYGAAMLAAVGSRAFTDVHDVCDAWVKITGQTDPGPDSALYRTLHERYRTLYPALAPVFRELAQ